MNQAVEQLRLTIARLRAPGGCPWDREQTSESLSSSLIEEAYEVANAIARNHSSDLEEELGDLLINILMQAEIASESDAFTLESIATVATEKLVRRHPHVFGESTTGTSEAVLVQWEEIKKAERAAKNGSASAKESLLDGVARAFPALLRAQKIQKKAAKAGFDWERPEDVVEKVREEIAEVVAEMASIKKAEMAAEKLAEMPMHDVLDAKARLSEEVGDLLFAVVNLARALGLDAESSLHAATEKFEERFRSMERALPEGQHFFELTMERMNELWETAKKKGH
jgi:MazG family protein